MLKTLDRFTAAYVEAALWSSCDDTGWPFDKHYGAGDIAPDSLEQMAADCRDFQAENADRLEGINPEQAGHDFWLTRNRHGTGFWDRVLGEVGEKLTEASHVWGECGLCIGADSLIHTY